ncbi:RNA 3'-terminal phosphate cyclase isoform X3 [Daktulosphaira vitifoliae]|nr:RNA 3'-terminal phosphate cyclase isoform X3 [Daktulosphaira vitifoliae]
MTNHKCYENFKKNSNVFSHFFFSILILFSFIGLSGISNIIINSRMTLKEIDGSILEGGGQIIRLSIALSSLFEQPVKITKIRAGRSNSGLKPQHLAGIHLVKQMCHAITEGDKVNSCELSFHPKSLKMGKFNLNIDSKTAASIPLMIQSILPVAIFTKHSSDIIMKGGTDVSFAPSMDYVIKILFPIFKKFGIDCNANIIKRGFFPKGGGTVQLTVNPLTGPLNPIIIEDFGKHPNIKGTILISGPPHLSQKNQIAKELYNAITKKLNKFGYQKVNIDIDVKDSLSPGGSIVLISENDKCLIGSSTLYDFKKSTVSNVTDEACNKLIKELNSKSCVDAYAMDNIIIFMALANGKSQIKCREITLHTKTAIYIVEEFTNVRFEITPTNDGLMKVTCEG